MEDERTSEEEGWSREAESERQEGDRFLFLFDFLLRPSRELSDGDAAAESAREEG